jgi:FkbM family methyltransferase
MNLLSKIANVVAIKFRTYILRDQFLITGARWFKDKGDETLRLDYPLTKDSFVFDLGGYRGDFAAAINERYGCKVYLFEPVLKFYQNCIDRFQGNEQIVCFNFGLSSVNDWLDIGLAENTSSFASPHAQGAVEKVQVKSVVECIRELNIDRIDLMKINIEGGEFDILPAIIESGDIKKISYLQVQFHNFVNDAESRRAALRKQLEITHNEMWNYNFIWESWNLKALPHE